MNGESAQGTGDRCPLSVNNKVIYIGAGKGEFPRWAEYASADGQDKTTGNTFSGVCRSRRK